MNHGILLTGNQANCYIPAKASLTMFHRFFRWSEFPTAAFPAVEVTYKLNIAGSIVVVLVRA
jgi:hypothetical protein